MPEGTPEPGPVRPERNPYLIDPGAAFVNALVKRIIFLTGTQAGKSFLQECVIGHRCDDDPCPVIYYGPTESNIKNKVEPLIMAMIRESKSLLVKFDAGNSTQFVKRIGSAILYLSYMGSVTETSSTSAALMLIDELDRRSENGEGYVVDTIEARGEAYTGSKLGITGTPTKGRVVRETNSETGLSYWAVADRDVLWSPSWWEWQSGTRYEWAVPCPHCAAYFIPHSALLYWPGRGTDKECGPNQAEREAMLICECCGDLIADKYRQSMNSRGVYVMPGQSVTEAGEVIGKGETEGNSYFSFWVSGLCSFSAKKSYGYLAKKFLIAISSGDPGKLLPVHNTGFGECYAQMGAAPPWEDVQAMAYPYKSGTFFYGHEFLLGTVDVQKNRLVYVVRAWYRGMGSQLVANGELWGDVDKPQVWDELAEVLDADYNGHDINAMGVDCGYMPDQVFAFVRRFRGRARALRGDNLGQAYRVVKVDVDSRGKARQTGDKRWDFDSPRAKAWVHSRIGWSLENPGFWLLPKDVDKDYCRQIVGEEWNEATSTWDKTGENHYLDCEAMQFMLAKMKGLDRKPGKITVRQLVDLDDPDAELSDDDNQKRKKKKTKRRSMADLGAQLGNG